jgi:hypothetical protein
VVTPVIIPKYKFPRDIITFQALVRLWNYGVVGMEAIKEFNKKFGSNWRLYVDRQYYLERFRLMGVISKRTLTHGILKEQVTQVMDMEKGKMSIGSYFKFLK